MNRFSSLSSDGCLLKTISVSDMGKLCDGKKALLGERRNRTQLCKARLSLRCFVPYAISINVIEWKWNSLNE